MILLQLLNDFYIFMLNKKNILITDSSHLFFNSISNKLDLLSNEFDITLGLTESHLTTSLRSQLNNLLEKRIIVKYFIIKDKKISLRLFYGLMKESKELRLKNFRYLMGLIRNI